MRDPKHSAPLEQIAPKLAKLLPVLSSNQPGEVVNAAAAISRTLAGVGADWHDLAAALTATPAPRQGSAPQKGATPQPRRGCVAPWTAANRLWTNVSLLNEWERDFVASVLERLRAGKRLSDKQDTTLTRIYRQRLGGAR